MKYPDDPVPGTWTHKFIDGEVHARPLDGSDAPFRPAAELRAEAISVAGNAFDQYQAAAMRTHIEDPIRLPCYALGLAGEAGEVADLIKKHLGHGHDLDRVKIMYELGDVLWYIAALSHTLGLSLSDIADANIEKLKRRYPDGFSNERSIGRTE